ncbi:winged helix-turn-helix domain-containing protein [Zavarzinella formosa]|uniref:winged helix-turn-helix domain-containing protein n=1 Tax=Zavarzinella formosa TaxID=360055 RepID=UPI0003797895|nr:LysR family transcriptional regulator [Zavarzinella formosa]
MLGDKPDWKLKVRAWVEKDGRKILGPGRVELLGHIDRLRSISAAAKQMNMSYRRAWGLVKDMNEAAGGPLVEVTTGGSGGGGAVLTPLGQQSIALYQQILDHLAKAASDLEKPASKK